MKKLYLIILYLLVSQITWSQVNANFSTKNTDFTIGTKDVYKVINCTEGTIESEKSGAPQLPTFSRNYVLPAGSVVTNLSVSNGSKIEMGGGNIFLYPTQPPCALNGKPCPDFVAPDPAIYNSNAPFPASTSTIANDATTFGYRVVKIDVCPFEYLPFQRKLYRFEQINITINYTIGQVEYQARISERRNEINKDFVKATVQNPTAIAANSKTANQIVYLPITNTPTEKLTIPWKPSLYGNIPEFVIITNNLLKPHFEVLAKYKTEKGIPTVIATVEQIYQNFAGVDNAEKIRNYLKSAHQFWGAGLFVLLGGDTAVVPGRIGMDSKNYTDLYYSDVFKFNTPNYNWNSNNDNNFGFYTDDVELGADNFIGRAPVDNINEAINFITKIIKYEKLDGVSNKNYVNNMLFLGSYYSYNHNTQIGLGADNSQPEYLYGGQQWHHKLANKPFLTNSSLNKWMLFDDYIGNQYQDYPGNEELSSANTLNRMSNGHATFGKFHLVSHYDHGSPFGIGVSGGMKGDALYSNDLDALSNSN